MAKVLLIQANYDLDSKENMPWMPVALVELATFIREKGHEVKILDRNLHPENQVLIKVLKNFNPDIVGMTCYTSSVIKDIKQVSKLTKENSSALVIIGGVHATIEPKSLLDFPFLDLPYPMFVVLILLSFAVLLAFHRFSATIFHYFCLKR